MMVEHHKARTDGRHDMESGTIARNAKAANLSDVMLNEMDYAARIGYQGEVVYAGRKTEDALMRRGLITFEYDSTLFAANKHGYRNPVLTVAGWAIVCPEGRPADKGRMTLDEAWDDAHQPTPADGVDFETRLMMTGIGMDVTMAAITDRIDETAPPVMAAIDEAAEILEAAATEPPAFQPNAVLAKARAIIEQRGWAQHTLCDDDGRVCAMGAIRMASKGNVNDEDDAAWELGRRIHNTPEWDGLSIPGWNDQHGQTEDGVLKLLY